jgi:hypothetical protein
MRLRLHSGVATLFAVCWSFGPCRHADSQLNVTYGSAGIQTLSYAGVVLEDLATSSGDAFHIWHMKLTDLQGNVLSSPSYGWGENNTGKSWNAATKTWSYQFVWGSVSTQFVQTGTSLNMVVTESNLASSGVILDGASIYPFALHFPQLPAGFTDPSYPQLAFNTTAPSITLANFGNGEVAAVVPSADKPLYSGFIATGTGISYTPLISSTTPDGLATFQPHNDRPVLPGQTDTFTVSLRFAPAGTAASLLATDADSSWAQTWPSQLHWTDRRPIGTIYLASSPTGGDVSQPAGYPNNPRRYFNDSNASDFDITTRAGLLAFQSRVLQQAISNVQNMQKLGAQGSITWDIEGEQYPQSTTYVCQPDSIAQTAPEMETVITDTASPYAGMKLDDAYFRIMTGAGFRVGVCIRPEHFTQAADGTAQQVYLPDASVAAELTRKIQFAHDRWGATLFYIDSTIEGDGAILDAGIFQQVASRFPDSLLIPEETTPKYYAYAAPFLSYIFHESLGTDPNIYAYYPAAFSAILINDADPEMLAKDKTALTTSVKGGDILMGHVDYWQANNVTIASIYANAGASGSSPQPTPPSAPAPVSLPTPQPSSTGAISISSPPDGSSITASINVQGSVAVSLDAAGSYLMVDGQEVGTARVISAPFVYPLDSTTLAVGSHKLQLWAHDQNNDTLLSAPIAITVGNAGGSTSVPTSPSPQPNVAANPISIVYPSPGQAISATVQVSAVVKPQLDAAGSYLIVDGVEFGDERLYNPPYVFPLDTTLLTAGQHSLQVWAHDTNNETLMSNTVSVVVTH